MSNLTPNLNLFKYDVSTDTNVPFSITEALNNNWDIIDEQLAGKADKTELDDEWVLFNTPKLLSSSTAINLTQVLDLSTILPTTNDTYELLISDHMYKSTTSGNAIGIHWYTDLVGNDANMLPGAICIGGSIDIDDNTFTLIAKRYLYRYLGTGGTTKPANTTSNLWGYRKVRGEL